MDGIADSGDLADDLRDVFTEVGQAAAAHGSGFAMVLDEMQNLQRSDLEALIVGLHRAKQKGLPVALVAAGLPLLPDLTGDAKSYAERGFEFRRIGPLHHAAAVEALVTPDAERRYLSAMAILGDGPQETKSVARLLGQTQQALSTLRDRLIKASLIYAPRRGCVDFTVPLCGDYIRRDHPLPATEAGGRASRRAL